MLVDAAFLHVLGDMIMSVGVILAALVIYFFPSLWYFDPICTYFFSIIVMVTTIPIIKNCIKVLMEAAPERIDVDKLTNDLLESNPKDNIEVHDVHVWTIAPGKVSMTAHIVSLNSLKSLAAATNLLRKEYNLHHTSIQVEGLDDKSKNKHAFKCANDIHE